MVLMIRVEPPVSELYVTSSGRPRDVDVAETWDVPGCHKDILCSRKCLGDGPGVTPDRRRCEVARTSGGWLDNVAGTSILSIL